MDRSRCVRRLFPRPCCLPRAWAGSASMTLLSRPAQDLLALRPVVSLKRQKRPSSQGFDRDSHPSKPPASYRANRPLPGWDFHPQGHRALQGAPKPNQGNPRKKGLDCLGFIRPNWDLSMGYGKSKRIISPPLPLAAKRLARRAVRADDLAKIARFPIFTKELYRQKIAEMRDAPASRAELHKSSDYAPIGVGKKRADVLSGVRRPWARIKRLDAEGAALTCDLRGRGYAGARARELEPSSEAIAKDFRQIAPAMSADAPRAGMRASLTARMRGVTTSPGEELRCL